MADIRIKDLATTASSTASDDFLAVDGSANGTRKLNAYSPTFGGNVVATGTLTVNSTTDSSSKDTGAIVTEGGLGVEKSASIGGNLTVSGTGTNTVTGATTIKGPDNGSLYVDTNAATNYTSLYFKNNGGSNVLGLYHYTVDSSSTINSFGGDLRFARTAGELARFVNSNGNLLIGTTTDSSNGKLQLATHTTSAGGIGFGTDTSFFRGGHGNLQLSASGAGQWSTLQMNAYDTNSSAATSYSPPGTLTNSNPIWFVGQRAGDLGGLKMWRYNGSSHVAAAFSIDTSDNATFAGDASIVKSSAALKVYDSQTVVGGGGGEIFLQHRNSGASQTSYASVKGYATNGSVGAEDGDLYLKTMRAGTLTLGLKVTNGGSVVVNDAAVATNATRGFLYVSSCAGTPTGTPETHTGRVPIVVDTTNNKLYFYSGGAWRDAGP